MAKVIIISVVRNMRKILFALAIFCTLPLCAQTVYTPYNVPNPKSAVSDGWISDPASYLTTEQAQEISDACQVLKKEVEVEVAVVMLPQRDRENYDRFEFCQTLFNFWGIGGSEKNTGVLVFFCDGPSGRRDIRIHTGGGMEGLLPDARCDEIIDNAIDYLAAGQYGEGVLVIVRQLYHTLTTNEAKDELLLGWVPQHATDSNGILWWIFIGFVVLWLLCYNIYKKAPLTTPVSLEQKQKILDELQKKQTPAGLIGWILPPVWILYLYSRIMRKRVSQISALCDQCGGKMKKLSPDEVNTILTPKQLTELTLKSKTYDIYRCEKCGHESVLSGKGEKWTKFSTCAECGAMASQLVSTVTLAAATYSSAGKREKTYRCQCCGKEKIITETIPRLTHSSSYSGSSRSYGSSHSGSGGSWGGGHSYGGGAGRSF